MVIQRSSLKQPTKPSIIPNVTATFYSNVSSVGVSGMDAYINFHQFPVDVDNSVLTSRILMSYQHLWQLYKLIGEQDFIQAAVLDEVKDLEKQDSEKQENNEEEESTIDDGRRIVRV
jgi:hypothetical protein